MAPGRLKFAGAVLAGGASRRMGRDKALLAVDGTPMVVRTAAALATAGAQPVVVVGGDASAIAALGLRVTSDRWPGEGPLGGIITALHATDHERTVVLAVDLVDPHPGSIARVAAASIDGDVAVPRVDGHRQPLHACWHRRCLPMLEDAFERGARAVREGLDGLDVVEVTDIAAAALSDADRPEELAGRSTELPSRPGGNTVTVPEIDVEQLAELLSSDPVLIDVREPDEYAEARVAGARLIPLGEVVDRVDEIPAADRVYVICAAGGRSMKAAEFLASRGVDAVNVAGGTKAWVASGRPFDRGA